MLTDPIRENFRQEGPWLILRAEWSTKKNAELFDRMSTRDLAEAAGVQVEVTSVRDLAMYVTHDELVRHICEKLGALYCQWCYLDARDDSRTYRFRIFPD